MIIDASKSCSQNVSFWGLQDVLLVLFFTILGNKKVKLILEMNNNQIRLEIKFSFADGIRVPNIPDLRE